MTSTPTARAGSVRLQVSEKKERQDVMEAVRMLKDVLQTRGVAGLYDGLPADTVATLLSSFCYFYAYSFLRTRVLSRKSARASKSQALSAAEEIVVGFLAGVASRAISSPFSVTAVRLQAERKDAPSGPTDDGKNDADDGTLKGVMRHIYAEHGLKGFWKGFGTTTLLCLNPSLTLFFYQAFRRTFLRGKDRLLPSPRQAFIGAAVSNVVAMTILYPLLLAKTRLQASKRDAQAGSRSMFDVWTNTLDSSGVVGLYQGLEAQLIKGFFNQGLTMMIKQRIERWIVALYLYRLNKLTKPMLYRYVYAIFYVD